MSLENSIKLRRSYYKIDKKLPIEGSKVVEIIKNVTELVPDAFNMKSARVVVAMGEKQNKLWETVYDAFGGKISMEKINGFKAAAGTILYFLR